MLWTETFHPYQPHRHLKPNIHNARTFLSVYMDKIHAAIIIPGVATIAFFFRKNADGCLCVLKTTCFWINAKSEMSSRKLIKKNLNIDRNMNRNLHEYKKYEYWKNLHCVVYLFHYNNIYFYIIVIVANFVLGKKFGKLRILGFCINFSTRCK